MSFKKQERGFTLIELVVVIAILAILAAFALPRFTSLSEQAHASSIQGTAGALSAGVALVKAQWVANGTTTATTDVVGFGDDDVDVSDDGWPISAGSDANSTTMTNDRCVEVWNALLQSNAPTVSTGTDTDYSASAGTTICTYTYQLDGEGSTITYNADNGEIVTTISP
ncbi:prepilin-type N-terminal cleavage/methylation domain-containing protein [Marinobacter sp. LN3S78]|uniref:prepilin-type N-terminal cleavage/methylation domain-containing protein n=1 Tax=Marinobacter sp. LN3S78 TaxID=3382300 RepID=UPI00387A86F5